VKLTNPSGIAREFFSRAVERRGVKLGPDERAECEVRATVLDIDGSFNIDAWWMKDYGKDMPYRHVRRRLYEREFHSKERVYDVFFQVTEEMVHELFPMLPRNGKWRLFGRRPR
jgi:hypothetical protein